MLGILGGGFGLYGYLPAAMIHSNEPVMLPRRYKSIIESRNELLKFLNKIVWMNSEDDLLVAVDNLIISRRPIDQELLISKCLEHENIKRIFLEKPLASSPIKAQEMLAKLASNNKICSFGFTFRFTNWANEIKKIIIGSNFGEQSSVYLKWEFMADHFMRNENSWKMDHNQGGGAIRFYGIHLIALLAEWGYDQVVTSNVFAPASGHSYFNWNACFKGDDLPYFFINLDSKSHSSFFEVSLNDYDKILYKSLNPFDQLSSNAQNDDIDPRCIYLVSALTEFYQVSLPFQPRIEACTNLWQQVESLTVLI